MTKSNPARLTEAIVRKAWEHLISVDLPGAAKERGWPVSHPDEFERVLLDQVRTVPGDCAETRDRSAIDLILAIELAERALQGKACFFAMTARSKAIRSGERPAEDNRCSGGKDLWRILADISRPQCRKGKVRREGN